MSPIQGPMTGRTVAITGASSGIGLAAARELARMGATVVMLNRSLERSEVAMEQMAADTGSDDIHLELVDLASFDSVRRGAARLARRFPAIDVLVNNAGVIVPERDRDRGRARVHLPDEPPRPLPPDDSAARYACSRRLPGRGWSPSPRTLI